ncbi:SSU ribosomal protein S15p (S13e) [Candidatus Pelagibacter sp. IMCC9063]|uniref:30S ribosomal protein S15 n=1 Tax=Pelagibacter sp. (strain IMCC9063) TaxID=1002672 RepID=UPI00020466FE|nr:30S ribosomal protein S15 [Candidatus Pelagibacter sp. IMCC9063]AEA80813.1 SSU ribosomal protein S15p (S13e) [Candidatus Pelagibacter sp. IMCC9063]|tara:strand:- start:180 stop:449 length:270 start_codon:yes stop_codon:yes gene_type:complete
MPKKKIEKKEVIASLQKHKTDVGSSEVQIGILTERVKYLSEHFVKNKKDKHSNTGLSRIITRRKKLLEYLSKKEPSIYKKVLEQLGLRK